MSANIVPGRDLTADAAGAATTQAGHTSLFLATRSDHEECAQALTQYGASMEDVLREIKHAERVVRARPPAQRQMNARAPNASYRYSANDSCMRLVCMRSLGAHRLREAAQYAAELSETLRKAAELRARQWRCCGPSLSIVPEGG